MRANYVQFGSPQFRVLSSKQLDELHFASLHILEKTGVTIDSEEALRLLGGAGADVSNPKRVKIPSPLVEQMLRAVPKNITLYTREGEPCIFLNGTRVYFGGVTDCPCVLDPFTGTRRSCYVEDAAALTRLCDFLPNITWLGSSGTVHGLPPELSERVALAECIRNTSKPVAASTLNASGLRAMLELCSIVAGGMQELRARPFFVNCVEPISPLVHGRDALEMSLVCAEFGIPNVVFSMLMAGATSPATFAGTLAVGNAELLSHLVVIQLKNPGSPVIYGAEPNIMDMARMVFPYGAPELYFLSACLTELTHYYKLPMFGTAGAIDAKAVGAEAGAQVMYQCLMSAFSGADFVHAIGLMDHANMVSPELIVFTDEIIDMVRVSMGGIEITDETLALDVIDRVGPGGTYLTEDHTLEHFREFWVPRFMDRSQLGPGHSTEPVTHCEDLLKEKTREILSTHIPKSLPEDMTRQIAELEGAWFKEFGLKYEYPKKQS
jgi:trimethylamine--corrinoid protein Co-methyltransferase